MAIGSSTSTPVKQLPANRGSGGAANFLNTTGKSAVQQLLGEQKTAKAAAPGSFFESEDWLRMKAFEIRNRITLYKNLGLSQEYSAAQQEGADVVKKYQALQAKASAKAIEDQVNAKLGLDTSA